MTGCRSFHAVASALRCCSSVCGSRAAAVARWRRCWSGAAFEFAVERAVFLTVLHRLMVSGSDRACEHWREDYRIDGIDGLQLHHLYRAMAFLGEELAETEQAGRTLAPRTIKDAIEEKLFAHRRDLFSELSVAFMDTTSLYFEGRGGETLGQLGQARTTGRISSR